MVRFLRFGLPLALVCGPSVASAQTSTEDGARRLFDQGVAREQEGKHGEACKSFRESLALVRELGPLMKVKSCDAREGKVLSARAHLKELIQRWPDQGAELSGLKIELAAIDKRVARIRVELSPGAAAPTRVEIDGRALTLPAADVELDPGTHELLIEQPNRPVQRQTVTLADGEARTLAVGAVELAAQTPPAPPARRVEESSGGLGGLGIGGIIAGGVGVLGFVGAGVTGGMVLAKESEFEDCSSSTSCTEIADQGNTLLVANGVLWGLGIAGVGLGATLLIVDLATDEGSGTKLEASFGPGRAAIAVEF